jgi:dTDP-4-dehydrorhamnose 3,5-epimerase
MKIEKTSIEGLVVIRLDKFEDERGLFYESFNLRKFHHLLDPTLHNTPEFVQDNISVSHKNVLRGLHFQTGEHAQGKLVQVLNGSVIDVAVDLREGSPTFGKHESVILSGGDNKLFWVPAGFAHGFKSMADNTHFHYKCTNYYNKESEGGIIWNDEDLGIDWGDSEPILSEKDLLLPKFRDIYHIDDKVEKNKIRE